MALFAATTVLLLLPLAWAQNPSGALSPELAPLAAKYQSDLAALTQTKDKALALARQPYLDALTSAQQRATTEAKPDEAKAVADEKEAVAAGHALAPEPSPLLPRTLTTLRINFLRQAGREEHEYTVHAQQVAAEYLRGLVFYETKARAAGQTDLLKQIQAEKLKAAALGAVGPRPAPGAGRNVVLNGDFAQKKIDGTPESWTGGGPGKGAVATEQGITFLRIVANDKKETWFLENIDRPLDAQELQVSVRLRSPDFKGVGPYGIVIAQRDAANQLVARDTPCVLKTTSPVWRTMTGVVAIRPETKKLIIRCNMVDCSATVDFTDVRVEAR